MIQQFRPRSVAGNPQDMGLFSSQMSGLSMQPQAQAQNQQTASDMRPAESIYNSGFTDNRDPYGGGVAYQTQVERGGERWQDVAGKREGVDASNYRGGEANFNEGDFQRRMNEWSQGHDAAYMNRMGPVAMAAKSINPLAAAFSLWEHGQIKEGDRARAEAEARQMATTYNPYQERQTETISTLRGRAPYSFASAGEAAAGPSSSFIARRESTWNPGTEVASEAQFSNLSQAERDAISRMRGR